MADKWDGVERRTNKLEVTGFCPAHINLVADIEVIKTCVTNIEKGMTFRQTIYASIIGISLTLVVQIVVFANIFGQLSNQVAVNTARLGVIERIHQPVDR